MNKFFKIYGDYNIKKIIVIIILVLFGLSTTLYSQTLLRSGIFLHHSTGASIWGPNGSPTSVSQEIVNYNLTYNYTGIYEVRLNEEWFPSDDNEWYTWDKIFQNNDPLNNIQPIIQNNKIVIIKSCFPSSNISGLGTPEDTLNIPSGKTIYNYKWHWRNIINLMKQYPDNFFVIWTNAPLVPNATNSNEALLSHQFSVWAKDTLAASKDPVFGVFPSNIYVFDFFHKLADTNGMLQLQYAVTPDDSHPNSAATELVAKQFVKEVFDVSIANESIAGIKSTELLFPSQYLLYQNYPNPFNPTTKINYSIKKESNVKITVYNVVGIKIATIVNEHKPAGTYELTWNATNLSTGLYFYRIQAESFVDTKKMMLLK